MLPEVGATELLVIAAIALIVVGPKDLPVMMRKVGQFLARMRGMANEFRASFDDMARQSELDELRREVEAMRSGRYLDPLREAAIEARDAEVDEVFADINNSLKGRSATHLQGPVEPEPMLEAPKPKRVRKKPAAAVEAAPKKPRARKKPEASA
jgi:sec-independent protein translocase protein TatB